MTALHQMRYYRGIVVPAVAKAKGMDHDQAHEWLKSEFFKKSTRLFTDDAFEAKLSEIRTETAALLGVWIPMPNEDPIPPNPPAADEREDPYA